MATSLVNVTVNGVVGKIEWESFRKGRAENGPYVTLAYLVAYADADAFADGVMGGFVSSGSGAVRNLPRQACPTNPTLYATRAEIEYRGETYPNSGTTADIFKFATVAVTYACLTWPQAFSDDPGGQQAFPNEQAPGTPFVNAECEIDYSYELITIPQGSLVFSDGKKLDAPSSRRVGLDTYRITRHKFPNLPTALVSAYRNKVNNTTFLGRSRGCVLFDGARTRFTNTADGTQCQMFELTFLAREYDWNMIIRPDDMTFDTVSSPSDTTKTPYKYDDIYKLLV